jgi:hypothetical protein
MLTTRTSGSHLLEADKIEEEEIGDGGWGRRLSGTQRENAKEYY